MKKFIILLLAVAGFCNDFKVVNVDGKEIKFKYGADGMGPVIKKLSLIHI